MLELMDNASISAVEAWQPMGLDTSAGALLIGQFDSPGSASDAKVLSEICEQSGAQETYVSEDPQEAEMLVGARRMVIPALESAGDWLLDDVAVPRTQLARTMVQIQEVAERHDVQIATFGHAGDGNLHPTIVTSQSALHLGQHLRRLGDHHSVLDAHSSPTGQVDPRFDRDDRVLRQHC